MPDSKGIGNHPRASVLNTPDSGLHEIAGNHPLFAWILDEELLHRTQEVGGSSPPSSTATKALRVRGFRRFGGRGRSPVIAVRFRH